MSIFTIGLKRPDFHAYQKAYEGFTGW